MTDRTTFRDDYEAEQLEILQGQAKERREAEQQARRNGLLWLGESRDSDVVRIKAMLPVGTNPKWWEKLERWLSRNPYKADDWDDLIDAARHPERYPGNDKPTIKYGDQRGKHLRGRPKSAEHRRKISQGVKARWETDRQMYLDATDRGVETRKRNAQLRREAEQAREDPY